MLKYYNLYNSTKFKTLKCKLTLKEVNSCFVAKHSFVAFQPTTTNQTYIGRIKQGSKFKTALGQQWTNF